MDVRCVLLDLDGTFWDATGTYRRLRPDYTPQSNMGPQLTNPRVLTQALLQEPPHVTQSARTWLRQARAADVLVVAATNLPQTAAEQIVAAANVTLDGVYGVTRTRRAKPSPTMLRQALQDFDIPPDQAVMLGNDLSDAAAARRAGVRFQWAGWSDQAAPPGVAVATTWSDVGNDAPEHVGRWLYKIYTEYDGLTPAGLSARAADGQVTVSWRQRIDEVEVGDPVSVWFNGRKVQRPGIYTTCVVTGVDLSQSTVRLRIIQTSTDGPLSELAGAGDLVKTRGSQVFWYSPRSTASCDIDQVGAGSCAKGSCFQCPTFKTVDRINLDHLNRPARLNGVDSYLPAAWIIAKRSLAYYSDTRSTVKDTTERFKRLKNGEAGLAQHFAELIALQASDTRPAWGGRPIVLVPVPLDPLKKVNGEPHRTLLLAQALADVLPRARVVEALQLASGVSKRRMIREGSPYTEFLQTYANLMTATGLPADLTDVVIVDDVCTHGGTLSVCAETLRSQLPPDTRNSVRVHAVTAGQMTIQAAVGTWQAIINPDQEPGPRQATSPTATRPPPVAPSPSGAPTRPGPAPASPSAQPEPAEHTPEELEKYLRAARRSLTQPSRLIDCRNTGTRPTELFIIGDETALATARLARNPEHQALLPIRGKILNVQKATISEVLNNEECAAIIQVIGAGSGRTLAPDLARYDRVILMTDSDTDGAHLRCLLTTLFFTWMRELLAEGRIFTAMTPREAELLKGAVHNGDNIGPAPRTSTELAHSRHPASGFGELSVEEVARAAMDPRHRTLKRLTLGDAQAAAETFELLMGSQVYERRKFLTEQRHQIHSDNIDA